MSEHDAIRDLLALAAAGALDADQLEKVGRHLGRCAACSTEFAGWQRLAGALKDIPTPQAPAGLAERTHARIERQLAAEAERRWNQGLMVFLVLFAWTLTLYGWPVLRMISRGVASWLDMRFAQGWMDLVCYTVLAWLGAAAAAFLLAWRYRRERRLA